MKTWLRTTKAESRSLETSGFAMPLAFSTIISPRAYNPGHSDTNPAEGATDLEP